MLKTLQKKNGFSGKTVYKKKILDVFWLNRRGKKNTDGLSKPSLKTWTVLLKPSVIIKLQTVF
jgi:hypothetical protein